MNVTYGAMFFVFWLNRRRERHLLLWSLSLILVAGAGMGFTVTRNMLLVALLLGAVTANVTLMWAGVRLFDGHKPFTPKMAILPLLSVIGYVCSAWFGYPGFGSTFATLVMAANVLVVGRYLLGADDLQDSFGRKIAAWSLLAYAPVYLVSSLLPLVLDGRGNAVLILVADQILNNIFVVGLFAMIEDRTRQKLKMLASSDGLTGVLNRNGLIARCSGTAETRFNCVLLADLDNFKRINDTWGHAAGDAVLREFVARVKACLREGDLIGRIGGEEFAIVVETTDWRAALRLAEEIRIATAKSAVIWDGVEIPVTVSIGVAQKEAGELFEGTMRRSDEALYRAKTSGRDRVAA